MATMTSPVWGGVARTVLTSYMEDGSSWAGPGCQLYAYAWDYGVSGCRHPGVDITMPQGTPLYAARAGTVARIRNQDISGSMEVVIRDALGHEHVYTHLHTREVRAGQIVAQGQRIGTSGFSESAHLHFEHRVPNSRNVSGWGFTNPETLLTSIIAPEPVAPSSAGGLNLSAINSDFRQIGDVPLSVYIAEFTRLSSPLLAQASTIYDAAKPMSALALAQMFMENKYSTTGIILQAADNNPLAMRPWNADPRRNGNKPVIHWQTRATVGQMNLPAHYAGAILDADGKYYARFVSVAAALDEYNYRLQANSPYKNGVYNGARTLQQMLNIYAPAGDVHTVTGVANEASGYYGTVLTKLNDYARMTGSVTPIPLPGGQAATGQHRFILAMGHRNADGGGAVGEFAWTPAATRALRDAIKARGGQAWIVQEEDGDSNRDMYPGGLRAMAAHAVTLNKKYGPFKAYLSMHYNGGGGAGFMAIFPDGQNRTGDAKAQNAVSVELARKIAAAVKSKNTVGLLPWTAAGPGVMSERESGVGAQGHDLGEMTGSRGIPARLILEAGGGDVPRDAAYINNPHWVRNVYCEAVVDGLEAQFGAFKGTTDRFIPGQAVKFIQEHYLHESAMNASPRTVNILTGREATIISGPAYGDGVPWWDVRVTGVGTGWVKEGVLTAAVTQELVDTLIDVLEDAVAEGIPDPGGVVDTGPMGRVLFPLDGVETAVQESGPVTGTVISPVSWVPGPYLGSWAALVEAAATNLLTNPHFANSAAGWSVGGAARADTAVLSDEGQPSTRLTISSTSSTPYIYANASVSAGTYYSFGVKISGPSGRQARLQISWKDGSGNTIGSLVYGSMVFLSPLWGESVIHGAVAPSGAVSAQVLVRFETAGLLVADVMYVSEPRVYSARYLTSFTPRRDDTGDLLPGHAWTGTANASTSTRLAGSLYLPEGRLTGITPARGSVLMRINRNDLAMGISSKYLFCIGTTSQNSVRAYYTPADGRINFQGWSGGTGKFVNLPVTAGMPEWITVYCGWESGQPLEIAIHDSGVYSGGSGTVLTYGSTWGSNMWIGGGFSGNTPLDAPIDQVMVLDRRLAPDQIVTARDTQYWSLTMLATGVPQVPDEPLPGVITIPIETDPYIPTDDDERTIAEPFVFEGRHYAAAVSIYKGDIFSERITPLALHYDGALTIVHNDDAPVKRTLDIPVSDVMDLREAGRLEPYRDTLIPFMTLTDDVGRRQVEQLGTYVLAPFGGQDTPTVTRTTIHGNDLTWRLALSGIADGWTAPGNREIGAVVSEQLRQQGFTTSQISIGNTGVMTPPQGVPYFPGTTWLEALNDLLSRAGWYHLWMNRRGILTSRRYSRALTETSPVIYYDTARGHYVGPLIERDPDWGRFGNMVVARKLPAHRNDPYIGWTAVNDDDGSPTSTKRLGPIMVQPVIEGQYETEDEAEADAKAALDRAQSFYNRVSLTTGAELTAEANDVIAIGVERAGARIITGRWWRQSWELHFNGASAMTRHNLNHVEVYS